MTDKISGKNGLHNFDNNHVLTILANLDTCGVSSVKHADAETVLKLYYDYLKAQERLKLEQVKFEAKRTRLLCILGLVIFALGVVFGTGLGYQFANAPQTETVDTNAAVQDVE